MFSISTNTLALLFAGFVIGVFFLLFILKMLGFGGDRQRRRRNRRRRYHDDYDDDDDDERGGVGIFPILIFLLIVGVAAASGISKIVTKSNKNADSEQSTQHQPKHQNDAPNITPDQPIESGLNRGRYTSDEEADNYNEETIPDVAQDQEVYFYIRVHTLSNPDGIESACDDLRKKGLSVIADEVENGTAIYVGPYDCKAAAQQAQQKNHLGGFIESL